MRPSALLPLCLAAAVMAADQAPPMPPPPPPGLSSVLVADKPLDWSGKIDGFIKVENAEVLLHFSIDEIVGIHRFAKDQVPQSIIVLSRPLVMGRNDTFLIVPDSVMKFEKLLNFVDSVRKNRSTAR